MYFGVPSEGALPPGLTHRVPLERDAPFLVPSFIELQGYFCDTLFSCCCEKLKRCAQSDSKCQQLSRRRGFCNWSLYPWCKLTETENRDKESERSNKAGNVWGRRRCEWPARESGPASEYAASPSRACGESQTAGWAINFLFLNFCISPQRGHWH